MRWLTLHKGNGSSSLLPALGASLLIAAVMVWFVSNNNTIFLRHQMHKHTRSISEPIPRVLALADAVAEIPSDYIGELGMLPRTANLISKRAFNHSERSQILRVYLELGGKPSEPISWCPVANQRCNDLVLVQVKGQQILLDPARVGALKKRGEFITPDQLQGSWSRWPVQIPSLIKEAKDKGWLSAWPSSIDRIDNLLAKVLTGFFILSLIGLRLQSWQQNKSNQKNRSEPTDDALGDALRRSQVQTQQRRDDEDELDRAIEEHHSHIAEAAIDQPVSDVMPTPSEGVEPQTQPGDDQLRDLNKGDSE